jgi:hypothetical protein
VVEARRGVGEDVEFEPLEVEKDEFVVDEEFAEEG